MKRNRHRQMLLRLFHLCSAFAVTWLLTSSAQPSKAQPLEDQESQAYWEAIQNGVEAFERRNYPEARAAFARAHEISPNARTYRALGVVAFELSRYRECVELLEAALKSREKPLDDAQKRSAERVLVRARGLIARVYLEVAPSLGSVLVDGVPVEPQEDRSLALDVGGHIIEVHSPGYLPERRVVSLTDGEVLTISIQLRAPESPASADSAEPRKEEAVMPERTRDRPRRWYKSPWLWSAVGLVAVGVGVGVAYAMRPAAETAPNSPLRTEHTPPGGAIHALGSW